MKYVAVLLTVVAAVPAVAQVASPPAQALQRNPTSNPDRINQEQRERLQQRATPESASPRAPDVEAPAPAAPTASQQPELRFTLTAIKFDASAYLPAAQLDALAASLIGREVSFADLQALVDQINQLYAKRGLTTARAALPAQQIKDGIVQVRLVEGRIGATTAEGASARSRAQALRYGGLASGTLASPEALAGRLRLFNLNNDAQLRARLTSGATFGTTDVTLAVAEPAQVSADVFTDNNGFDSTGTAEVGAVVRGYRLLGDADRESAVLVASRGVLSGNVSINSALGDRVRIGVNGSYGRTRVLFGPLASLGVVGSSYGWGSDLAALVAVTDRATVTATASVQAGLSETDIDGEAVIRNRSLNSSVGAIVTYAYGRLQETVQSQVTVAHVRERLSATGTTTVLFQGSAALTALVASHVQARLRADWQFATQRDLPGILQYQIGGSRSLRAFSPGIAAGDQGYSVGGEFAYSLGWRKLQLSPYAFVDHAETSVRDAITRAEAAGAGLDLALPPHLSVRATLATDIGHTSDLPRSTRAFVSTTLHF